MTRTQIIAALIAGTVGPFLFALGDCILEKTSCLS